MPTSNVRVADAGGGGGTVTFDTSGSTSASDTTTPSNDFTVVGAGGANMLIAVVAWTHNAAQRTVTGVTYNSVPMTDIGQTSNTGGTHAGAALFLLASPATGLNTLQVTMSGNTDDVVYGFMSFSGCNATQGGTGAQNTGAAGTTASSGNVTGVANGLVVGVFGGDLLGAGVTCDDTERVENESNINNPTALNAGETPTTGATSMDWTKTNGIGWAAAAFPLAPS